MRALILCILISFGVLAAEAEEVSDTTAIEATHAAWAAKQNGKNRKAFDKALEAYAGPATTATIRAHLARMSSDVTNATPSKLRDSATAASVHLEAVSSILPQHYTDARMIAAIALFHHRQSRDARLEMAHVEGWARKWRKTQDQKVDNKLHDQMLTLEYRALAWGMAMDAYYQSTPDRGPTDSEIDEIDNLYKVSEAPSDAEEREMPFCDGDLVQEPPVRYKGKQARNYLFGAVVATFELENGKVANLKIAASVPSPEFNKNAEKAISQWYWRPANAEIVGKSCSLDRKNIVQPIVFELRP